MLSLDMFHCKFKRLKPFIFILFETYVAKEALFPIFGLVLLAFVAAIFEFVLAYELLLGVYPVARALFNTFQGL